jgi:hypothetical protein
MLLLNLLWGRRMDHPLTDKEAILVDVSGIRLEDLLRNDESPLAQSLKRIAAETDSDVVAGFSQGLS